MQSGFFFGGDFIAWDRSKIGSNIDFDPSLVFWEMHFIFFYPQFTVRPWHGPQLRMVNFIVFILFSILLLFLISLITLSLIMCTDISFLLRILTPQMPVYSSTVEYSLSRLLLLMCVCVCVCVCV